MRALNGTPRVLHPHGERLISPLAAGWLHDRASVYGMTRPPTLPVDVRFKPERVTSGSEGSSLATG